MEVYEDKSKNIFIRAKEIRISQNVSFGENIRIHLKGTLEIGSHSRLGSNTEILANDVVIGKHLFNSSGLRIGGGGRQNPNANFQIGDRCTIHNNFINVCEPVVIGDDVGLSPETSILTHGYWLSVLDGYPATFSGVKIGNGVIVGYRSLIMMGVHIADGSVVGAQSLVSKSIKEKGIYAGSPARFIKEIKPLSKDEKRSKANEIIKSYIPIAEYHEIENPHEKITLNYPILKFMNFSVNLETFSYEGEENEETDDLRDFLRKYGIRIYTERPFKSKFSF